ncbi:glutaminyl-peptide cyclotransferase [Nitrosovibrio sp. Nv6]|uniref:glutaminyl-peptide cyclotransferase n=1 Tax=Nitrosovibrio sp. Nv6 TaxID=1855340 RepID=UPI0008C8C7D0|nr:glutaminyl-peptide cyclotransferase [Nitrosovibrio sp. Nv6]SEP27010.1 Glutamine cyclotransferase [Nitrosovibrio sp. Nv6]
MKHDKIIQLLDYCGLKKPLALAHFHLRTHGLPKVIPQVKRILPHDSGAYTQGLAFHDKHLYENTGLVGASRLRCLDPESGDVRWEIRIENEWCEGIAVLNGCLVQLTYTSGRAIVYDLYSLKPCSEFTYEGEGWGLARCRGFFLMSNGSNKLTFRDAQFSVISSLSVHMNRRPLERINDLECVNGRIYANVQFDSCIYEIDSTDGRVLRVIDCRAIVAQSGRRDFHDMINGIAYSPSTETFYVTGKRWPRLFEIFIPLHPHK